jgi:hypothetical protein
MSEREEQHASPRRRRRGLIALAALGVIAAVVAYALLAGGRGPSRALACGGAGAPEVARVTPDGLAPLRVSVQGVLPERVARLYEEGTVVAGDAWSDGSPAPPPVSAGGDRPAGYEMRWWAPNGDDIVADVFAFDSAQRARRFLTRAAVAGCRQDGAAAPADRPPLARNVTWVNPDGVSEADVYVVRGRRVYRLADVPAGQRGHRPPEGGLTRALLTIDTLACLLPEAQCGEGGKVVPA